MGHIRWSQRPELEDPVVIAAFEGWNDAGDAATLAARFLRDQWGLRPCADLDPEEFYDFTATRPEVRLLDGVSREVRWPSNAFYAGSLGDGRPDMVVLLGTEPQLRWRTFSEAVMAVAEELDARLVVTLGALLTDIPHTRPVPLVGTAYDTVIIEQLGLEPSSYEGPTGIVGVLHDACRQRDIPSASLWAAVPTYVPGATSPKAALALVSKLADLLGLAVDTTELEIGAATYERQVSELVEGDDDLKEFVARLDEALDDHDDAPSIPDASDLVAEVERFLRDRRPE